MQPKSIILFFYGYILFFRRQIDNKKLEKYLDDTCKILLIEAHNKSKPFKEILK